MRLLLLSDTHGNLSIIDDLAREVRADAVVHAGDFGFYDRESVGRLSARELRLRVLHSDLRDDVKKQAHGLELPALKRLVEVEAPLSELPAYLDGARSFEVPVYAVWGNHEDRTVVERLSAGELRAGNLHLLAPHGPWRVGPFRLFGLGGNLLVGRKLFDRLIAGGAGKIWATLSEVGALLDAVEAEEPEPDEVRVLVTHVSPGKEPLVGRLGVWLRAHFLVSGHMGSPYCAVWNEFTIREPDDAQAWLDRDVERVMASWAKAAPRVRDPKARRLIERGLELLGDLPGEPVKRGRGRVEPPWFRDSFCINLPDAGQGHAVLSYEDGRVALETRSSGRRPS